jgi:hypothetical protein
MDAPLLAIDGGHGMIFKTLDGKLMMAIHQPNSGNIGARLFELTDTGESIRIEGEMPMPKEQR